MSAITRTYKRITALDASQIAKNAVRHGRSIKSEIYSMCRETLPKDEAARLADIISAELEASRTA